MKSHLLLVTVSLAGCFAAQRIWTQGQRIAVLERAPRALPQDVHQLADEIATVRTDLAIEIDREVAGVRAELGSERSAGRARLAELETSLSGTDHALAEQYARLARWESVWDGQQPDAFQKELGDLREHLEARSRTLGEMAQAAARVAEEDRIRIATLDRTLAPLAEPRDTARMWSDLVGPVVQLAGDATVGSGVLLESRPAGEGKWRTHVLTAWHVVRDIYGSPDNTSMPVPVKIYLPDGSSQNETAHLVAHDVDLDLALLALDSDRLVSCGARLATRSHLAGVRIFDSIYAVGCPLGNDPIPTAGEIASTHHEVDGGHYWMISAPTYVGNSGGGIFDARTHELLGIFSKIYTHGALRTTIVPHMGLATPLSTVYTWLDGTEFAYLEASEVDAQTQTASAKN